MVAKFKFPYDVKQNKYLFTERWSKKSFKKMAYN